MSSMIGNRGLLGSTGTPQANKLQGYNVGQLQNFSPEQMQLFKQLFSQVSPDSYTSRLASGDQSLFGEMEAPALKQFNELQGNLASRFSGMGSLGSRRSSGFQNTASQAGSDFAQQLQSRRQELQRQAIRDLMGMGSELLSQRPYENFYTPKPKSGWEEFLSSLSGGVGSGIGSLVGGLF